MATLSEGRPHVAEVPTSPIATSGRRAFPIHTAAISRTTTGGHTAGTATCQAVNGTIGTGIVAASRTYLTEKGRSPVGGLAEAMTYGKAARPMVTVAVALAGRHVAVKGTYATTATVATPVGRKAVVGAPIITDTQASRVGPQAVKGHAVIVEMGGVVSYEGPPNTAIANVGMTIGHAAGRSPTVSTDMVAAGGRQTGRLIATIRAGVGAKTVRRSAVTSVVTVCDMAATRV